MVDGSPQCFDTSFYRAALVVSIDWIKGGQSFWVWKVKLKQRKIVFKPMRNVVLLTWFITSVSSFLMSVCSQSQVLSLLQHSTTYIFEVMSLFGIQKSIKQGVLLGLATLWWRSRYHSVCLAISVRSNRDIHHKTHSTQAYGWHLGGFTLGWFLLKLLDENASYCNLWLVRG